jgi:hypothetical protein
VGRLRAVGAVFGTSAGLDTQERTALHVVRRLPGAVRRLSLNDQIRQGKRIDSFDLVERPCMTQGGLRHGFDVNMVQ